MFQIERENINKSKTDYNLKTNSAVSKSNKMFYSTQEYISRLVVVVEESSHHFYFRSTQIKINGRFFRLAAKPAKPLFIWISFS